VAVEPLGLTDVDAPPAARGGVLGALFGPDPRPRPGWLWPRWLWLRALGLIFFSAFYSLWFQIHGLIGPDGLLPVAPYLDAVTRAEHGWRAWWYAPSLLWLRADDAALTALVAAGLVVSTLLVLNVWPRLACALATVLFLSFIGVAEDFASYQSDGMLLEAGFLSCFFAPSGVRPGLGATSPPSWASRWMLIWEMFRIYFESGVVKVLSGDVQWRTLTAMDHYYENGPLPTWIGWYAQQRMPHAFHAATAAATLVIELGLVWLCVCGRRGRLAFFAIATPLQIGIILTANYAFLNYIVLTLAVLLLDDAVLARLGLRAPAATAPASVPVWRMALPAVALTVAFWATVVEMPGLPRAALPSLALWPSEALAPFRIANRYGLFAVMTVNRYEIEFQGSHDGTTWTPYPFRYKPQDPFAAPRIYAPYQPRFEWNLWFASLGTWQRDRWVVNACARLMEGSPSVLALFAGNPFADGAPTHCRSIRWQYWFTDPATKAATGAWWRREERGIYAPVLERGADGAIRATSTQH
jgi:Lipase maturation factor